VSPRPRDDPAAGAPRWPLSEVLEAMVDQGLEEAEVYVKRGRSRRLETTLHTESSGFHHERGWAVRAGGPRASFFLAGTGDPSPEGPWPAPDGRPLRLPDPVSATSWQEPADFDAPLTGEREGFQLLAAIARELDTELPGTRLLHALLEDGSSESEVRSQRGIHAHWKSRVAALRLTATVPASKLRRTASRRGLGSDRHREPVQATLVLAEREARRFHPQAVARRLADRLVVRAGPPPEIERDRGEVLLAPAVVRRLLGALTPLLVGPRAASRVGRFHDRRGHIGGDLLTLVDDGGLDGGLLTAPVDGEGMPSREVVLVEAGVFRQPLVAWNQVRGLEAVASGCARRASWRDLPVPGPTHLYLAAGSTPVAGLLAEVARGYYFLETTGAPRMDFDGDAFQVPVAGFAVGRGRAAEPVSGVVLQGAVSSLLRNLHGAGRDLTYAPEEAGLLGTPSLLVSGLEVRCARPAGD